MPREKGQIAAESTEGVRKRVPSADWGSKRKITPPGEGLVLSAPSNKSKNTQYRVTGEA